MDEEYYHTKESVNEYIHLAKDVSGKKLIEQFNKELKRFHFTDCQEKIIDLFVKNNW